MLPIGRVSKVYRRTEWIYDGMEWNSVCATSLAVYFGALPSVAELLETPGKLLPLALP